MIEIYIFKKNVGIFKVKINPFFVQICAVGANSVVKKVLKSNKRIEEAKM